MKKIIDSYAFTPQEDMNFYLDPKRDRIREWSEPPTREELKELFEEWPAGTKVSDVFPHCRSCFNYPIIDDNNYLYLKLTQSKEFRGLFDPLDFFNLLYEHLHYCLNNVEADPQIIIDHLLSINLVKRKLHFLLYALHYIINGLNGSPIRTADWPNHITLVANKKIAKIHLEIIFEYKNLEKDLGIDTGSEIFRNTRPVSLFSNSAKEDMKKKLTQPQIALIAVYEKDPITKGNCSKIAMQYGYYSPTSGEGLRQDYEFYLSTANRMSKPNTRKKFENKILLFESIVELLTHSARDRAMSELKILKTYFESQNW